MLFTARHSRRHVTSINLKSINKLSKLVNKFDFQKMQLFLFKVDTNRKNNIQQFIYPHDF